MNYEVTRVYRDIIEEVITKLEEEGEVNDICKPFIYELQNDWSRKISEYTEASSDMQRNQNTYIKARYDHDRTYEKSRDDDRDSLFDDDLEYIDDSTFSEDEIENCNNNYLMCLFVKVHRSRNKWKCTFKQGFVNIGNVDFAFSNAQGELEW